MDFSESKAAAAREIALAFGVPPLILGLPGDNTFSNYSEAHRAFWRQTVLPLVTRVQKSFQAWLAPGYGPFRFDYNADRLEALATERAAEWERVGKAPFLSLDEQREAVGYGPAPKNAVFGKDSATGLERRYSPSQPRVPAGSPEGGEWTSGGRGGGSESSGSEDVALNLDRDLGNAINSQIERVQEKFDVDLAEEEGGPHGGHAYRDHVGKSEENLRERTARTRVRVGPLGVWKDRIGSFSSLAAANKLVNSTLSQNRALVEEVIAGKRPFAVLEAWFDSPTGYESYAPSFTSTILIRDTFGVRVVIWHDRISPREFRIRTAFPVNRN
jgi:hypothetical protein